MAVRAEGMEVGVVVGPAVGVGDDMVDITCCFEAAGFGVGADPLAAARVTAEDVGDSGWPVFRGGSWHGCCPPIPWASAR